MSDGHGALLSLCVEFGGSRSPRPQRSASPPASEAVTVLGSARLECRTMATALAHGLYRLWGSFADRPSPVYRNSAASMNVANCVALAFNDCCPEPWPAGHDPSATSAALNSPPQSWRSQMRPGPRRSPRIGRPTQVGGTQGDRRVITRQRQRRADPGRQRKRLQVGGNSTVERLTLPTHNLQSRPRAYLGPYRALPMESETSMPSESMRARCGLR